MNTAASTSDWPTQKSTSLPGQQRPTPEFSIDLRRLFLGHKLLLLFGISIGLGFGYLKFTGMTPEFASSARILVVQNKTALPVDGAQRLTSQKAPIDTHIELMRTPVILARAVEEGKLPELRTLSGTGNPIGVIAGGLTISQSSQTDEILDLSYRGPDAFDCQKILNAVVAAYIDFVAESQEKLNIRTVQMISKARDDLDQTVREKQEEIQLFREQSTLTWNGDIARNVHQERLTALEIQRTGLRMEAAMLNAELESIEEALAQGQNRDAIVMMALNMVPKERQHDFVEQERTAAITDVTELDTLNDSIETRLLPLRIREQSLLSKYGIDHPEVIGVRREIEMTKSLLTKDAENRRRALLLQRSELARIAESRFRNEEEEGARDASQPDVLQTYMVSLAQQINVIRKKTVKLDAEYDEEHEAAQIVAIEVNRHRHMNEDLQRAKRLYDILMEELQEVNLVTSGDFLAVESIANPGPGRQVAPILADNLVLGGLLGLLAGLAISFLLELSDRSFRGPEQIVSQLGLPVVGHIPTLSSRNSDHPESDLDRTLIAFHSPRSRLAESYRAVRVPIMFGAAQNNLKVIQITSPDPGDGKSTMSSNLSIVLANSGKRCVLIDCDFRRPKIHKLFKADNKTGFSSVIQGEESLLDAIQATPIENLDLLPTGPRVKNPAELILSPKFDECLAALRDQYDFIIVDTPPVLAVTDAAAVASKVDGVLLVMRITKRVQLHAARARETLELIGANILGVAVNGVGDANSYAYGTGVYSSGSAQYQYSKSPYYGGYGNGYRYARYGYRDYYNDKEESSAQQQKKKSPQPALASTPPDTDKAE